MSFRRAEWVQVKSRPEDAVFGMVMSGMNRARDHGLTIDSDIATFVSLMFSFAPNFDAQPAIHAVLSDERFSPNERLELLIEQTTDEQWDEAEESYDETAWALPA
jgi:hypothetical protein